MQISISNGLASKSIYDAFVAANQVAGYYGQDNYGNDPEIVTYAYDGVTGGQNRQFFRLMKGTVPTDFSALTLQTSRSTDLLVEWSIAAGSGWATDGIKTWWYRGTNLVYATAGGTATWLWWYSGYYNSGTPMHQAVFTVGSLGSGSDFELINTTIISGNGYRLVNGPRLTMATEWTY